MDLDCTEWCCCIAADNYPDFRVLFFVYMGLCFLESYSCCTDYCQG